MSARGMTPDEDTFRIATKARGILVEPCDTSPYLRRHRPKVPASLFDGDKIQGHIVRPGIDENLGRIAVLLCRTHPPGAARDEEEHQGAGSTRPRDVKLCDVSRTA